MFFSPPFSAPSTIVTLSGENITHNSGGIGASAGIRFNTDGTVDKKEGAVYTQIDSGTDWIRPDRGESSSYDVRFTGLTGDQPTTAAAVENTWIAISVNREWLWEESGGGIISGTCTFEIRRGATTLDSASYTITADDT